MSRLFCPAIICPAHSAAERLPNRRAATRQTLSDGSRCGEISLHCREGSAMWPGPSRHYSQHISHYHTSSPSNLPAPPWGNHTAGNISVGHLSLMFASALYHLELPMTNNVLKRNHINVLDKEEDFFFFGRQ